MKKFYTAKNDLIFKTIMLEQPELLKEIIERIIKVKIDEIIILNSELPVTYVRSKKRIVDLLVKSKDRYINVELNSEADDEVYKIRNTTYLFNVYSERIKKGEEYIELLKKEFIAINLSYRLKEEKIKYEYKIQDDNKKEFINNFKIIEINMDKIKKDWYILNKKEKEEYKYLYMLDLNKEELKSYCGDDVLMEKYENKVRKLNEDEKFTYFLTDEEDGENIYNSRLKLAEEKATQRGLEKGMQQGMQQGIERGIEQGIEQGSKETSINIAKEMLKKEMNIDDISEITKLSVEQIKKIKKNNL